MDSVWEVERMKLDGLMQAHPGWSSSRLADAIQHKATFIGGRKVPVLFSMPCSFSHRACFREIDALAKQ